MNDPNSANALCSNSVLVVLKAADQPLSVTEIAKRLKASDLEFVFASSVRSILYKLRKQQLADHDSSYRWSPIQRTVVIPKPARSLKSERSNLDDQQGAIKREEILQAFKAGSITRAVALKQLDTIEPPVLFREYRCPKCKVILGGLNARTEEDLPRCPNGHKTEFVPKAGSNEVASFVRQLGLDPNSRESQERESKPDPLTYRQRMKKGSTH